MYTICFPFLFSNNITTSLDFVRFTIYLPNRIGLLANITKTQTCCRHLAIDTHLQRFRHSRTREPHPTTEELGEPKSEHDIEANHLHHRGTICKMLNTEVFFNTEAGLENGIFVKMVTISTCWMSWTSRVVYFKIWLSQVIQLSIQSSIPPGHTGRRVVEADEITAQHQTCGVTVEVMGPPVTQVEKKPRFLSRWTKMTGFGGSFPPGLQKDAKGGLKQWNVMHPKHH